MTDLEPHAGYWLARYREEERPPPEVDIMIRTRIRRESRGHSSTIWVGTFAIAAAAILLLVWAFDPRGPSRSSERTTPFSAVYAGITADIRGATERALLDRALKGGPVQVPQPTRTPELVEQPASQADVLPKARGYIDAGDYDAALELLKPCRQKVGTDALLEECELLVIEATCRSGDLTGGRQKIAIFRDGRPGSIYTKSLSRFCP